MAGTIAQVNEFSAGVQSKREQFSEVLVYCPCNDTHQLLEDNYLLNDVAEYLNEERERVSERRRGPA